MIIDSHIHINSKVVDNVENSIQRINDNKCIQSVINIGLNLETSKEIINISKNNNKFYNSIGIHPLYIENEDYKKLYDLITDKTVAIGEIGLDNSKNNFYDQRKYLIKQIIIANELKLPVIIHANNTNKEIVEIFKKYVRPIYGCVFHCFQPDIETLKYLLANGYFISFAGRITYKNAKKSIEVIKRVPNNNFIIETDSPYIPIGLNKELLSDTMNIDSIINKISEIKKIKKEEVERLTINNVKTLFKKIR